MYFASFIPSALVASSFLLGSSSGMAFPRNLVNLDSVHKPYFRLPIHQRDDISIPRAVQSFAGFFKGFVDAGKTDETAIATLKSQIKYLVNDFNVAAATSSDGIASVAQAQTQNFVDQVNGWLSQVPSNGASKDSFTTLSGYGTTYIAQLSALPVKSIASASSASSLVTSAASSSGTLISASALASTTTSMATSISSSSRVPASGSSLAPPITSATILASSNTNLYASASSLAVSSTSSTAPTSSIFSISTSVSTSATSSVSGTPMSLPSSSSTSASLSTSKTSSSVTATTTNSSSTTSLIIPVWTGTSYIDYMATPSYSSPLTSASTSTQSSSFLATSVAAISSSSPMISLTQAGPSSSSTSAPGLGYHHD